MILLLGIPEESDDDFKDTMELIEKIRFINSYSFIFSPRPGTVLLTLNWLIKKNQKKD